MSQHPNAAKKILDKAKEVHGSTYLTLISIVQSVTFSFLMYFVINNYNFFCLVGWILAFSTFVVIVLVWNEYVMGIISFVWIPNLIDSALPFLLGVSEVVTVQMIANDPIWWFFWMTITLLIGFIAFVNMYWRAWRDNDEKNKFAFKTLGNYVTVSRWSCVILAIPFFIFWLFKFEHVIFVIISVLLISLFFIRTVLYWRTLINEARKRV